MRTNVLCLNGHCDKCDDPRCGHHCHIDQDDLFTSEQVEPVVKLLPPVARNTDPVTSHDATPAPTSRTTMMRQLLTQFRTGGVTAEQAADAAGYTSADGAWKRVSDLRNAGYIEATDRTHKARSGREQTVWEITQTGWAWLGGRL